MDTPRRDSISDAMLDRFLAGESTEDEAQLVSAWLAADPSKARRITSLRSALAAPTLSPPDIDRALERLKSKQLMSQVIPFRPRRLATYVLMSAASLAAVIGLATWKMSRDVSRKESVAWISVATRAAETKRVEFPDGSSLTVGPLTHVRYKPDPGEISVIVDGMAGFSVVHDKRRLFRVNAGNASVVDIGTEFAVRSYPQDTVALVYVKSGLVEVRASNSLRRRGIQVGAHQAIAVGAMGSLSEESASELANYEAELDGRLDFQNRTVASIAETLSHWFGVHVVIEGRSLQEKRVTGVYNTPQLNSILDAIAETTGARYRIDGQTVTMSERR